jgi:hypothetical protein
MFLLLTALVNSVPVQAAGRLWMLIPQAASPVKNSASPLAIPQQQQLQDFLTLDIRNRGLTTFHSQLLQLQGSGMQPLLVMQYCFNQQSFIFQSQWLGPTANNELWLSAALLQTVGLSLQQLPLQMDDFTEQFSGQADESTQIQYLSRQITIRGTIPSRLTLPGPANFVIRSDCNSPQQERSVMPPHFLLWCDCPQDDLAQLLQQYLTGLYRQAGVQVQFSVQKL